VMTADKHYLDWMRAGGSAMSDRTYRTSMAEEALSSVGHTIEHDSKEFSRWKPLARALGITTAQRLAAWWYRGMSKILWGTHDVLGLQRAFELQRASLLGLRRGLSLEEAVDASERFIASYRIPSRLSLTGRATVSEGRLGQAARQAALTAKSGNVFVFAPYHWSGRIVPFISMARGLTGKYGVRGFADSVGAIAALYFVITQLNPWMNKQIASKVTGQEGSEMSAGGAAELPTRIYLESQKPAAQRKPLENLIAPLFQLNPIVREALQELPGINRDFFTGKPIREGGAAQQVVGTAEHAAGSLIQPFQSAEQYLKGTRSPLEQVFATRRPPTPGSLKFQKGDAKRAQKDARKDYFMRMLGINQ
jgi:hypothetical protein